MHYILITKKYTPIANINKIKSFFYPASQSNANKNGKTDPPSYQDQKFSPDGLDDRTYDKRKTVSIQSLPLNASVCTGSHIF